MYKNKYIKSIVFLILLLSVFFVLISASSSARYEPTKQIDSGKKIIKVNNSKYEINWKTDQVMDQDKKYVYIKYKSLKNKSNNGYLVIEFYKTSKNKMKISKELSSMRLGIEKTVKLKTTTDNYYWIKLRPKITNIIKKPILNKAILKYNETRYFNRTIKDSITGKNTTNEYQMNWVVYYYTQTSSIEIMVKYTNLSTLNKSNTTSPFGNSGDFDTRIDKFIPGKLKLTINPHVFVVCGSSIYYKYVKTNLTPKQYYLNVYKKLLEKKNLV